MLEASLEAESIGSEKEERKGVWPGGDRTTVIPRLQGHKSAVVALLPTVPVSSVLVDPHTVVCIFVFVFDSSDTSVFLAILCIAQCLSRISLGLVPATKFLILLPVCGYWEILFIATHLWF